MKTSITALVLSGLVTLTVFPAGAADAQIEQLERQAQLLEHKLHSGKLGATRLELERQRQAIEEQIRELEAQPPGVRSKLATPSGTW